MIKAIFEHYKLLLTLKHNGGGFPSTISPAMMVFIAAYFVMVIFEIFSKGTNIPFSMLFAFIIAAVFISIAPQAFVGMVLLKILELASISIINIFTDPNGVNNYSHISDFVYIYLNVCVLFLLFKCKKKPWPNKS